MAWICLVLFFRIGAFQRVTAEKIEKIPLRLGSRLGLWMNIISDRRALLFYAGRRPGGTDSDSKNTVAPISVFGNISFTAGLGFPVSRKLENHAPPSIP
jgi:hypothetical protein